MADPIILEFRAETKRLQQQLDLLDKKVEELRKDGKKATDELDDGLEKSGRQAKRTTQEVSGLNKAFNSLARRIAATFAIESIRRYTVEAVRLAGQMEGVEKAFQRIGNQTLLNKLREATKGTVDDLQLMQQAVRADNFQIPLESLASLFEFARRRAKETGEEVDFLVNSIIAGIGRKSPLILDNLGISAVRLRKELKGVGVEAADVGEISEIIGRIAQEEMEKMGDEVETTKDQTDRLNASLTNLQIAIGERLTPAINKSAKSLADFFDEATKGVEELGRLNKTLDRGFLEQLFKFPTDVLLGFRDKLIKTQREAEVFAQSAAEAAQAGRWSDAADDIAYLEEKLAGLKEGSDEYLIVQKSLNDAQNALNKAVREAIGLGLDKNIGDEESIGIIKSMKEQLKVLNDELENATSQQKINEILIRRAELQADLNRILDETKIRVQAIINKEKNLIDDGVDPELALPTFPEIFSDDLPDSLKKAEEEFEKFYDNLLMMRAENSEKEAEWILFKSELERQQLLQTLQLTQGFFQAVQDLALSGAEQSKELALFNATIGSALAAIQVFSDPTLLVGQKFILAATIAAQLAAQVSRIENQQVPSFFHGTEFFIDSPSKGRKRDDGIARLHYGEAVITADANKRNKGLSSALNKGRENNWIHSHHVLPALMAQKKEFEKQQKRDFATAITQSMALNMPDERIVREVKRSRLVQQAILEAYKTTGKRNPYRA